MKTRKFLLGLIALVLMAMPAQAGSNTHCTIESKDIQSSLFDPPAKREKSAFALSDDKMSVGFNETGDPSIGNRF